MRRQHPAWIRFLEPLGTASQMYPLPQPVAEGLPRAREAHPHLHLPLLQLLHLLAQRFGLQLVLELPALLLGSHSFRRFPARCFILVFQPLVLLLLSGFLLQEDNAAVSMLPTSSPGTPLLQLSPWAHSSPR